MNRPKLPIPHTVARRSPWSAAALGLCMLLPLCAWAETTTVLRVMTYNIHRGKGMDGRVDLDRLARIVRQSGADLVSLQEVDKGTSRSFGVDQCAELGRLTGMHAAFGRAIDFDGGQYGIAALSRFPFLDTRVDALPGEPGREGRAALGVRIDPDGPIPEIRMVATHLDEGGTVTSRMMQVREITRLYPRDMQMPVIMAGDFNSEPDRPPIAHLMRGWNDAAAESPAPTFPADAPARRIDYVFTLKNAEWRVHWAHVLKEDTASDHRPLVVELEYRPAERQR